MLLMKVSVLSFKEKKDTALVVLLLNCPQILTFMTDPLNILFDDFVI